jgi:phosphopantetheinyl transferase (holo-ACP synthase)
MPLTQVKNIDGTTVLGIWHIRETRDELKAILGTHVSDASQNGGDAKTPIHWYASRVLLQNLFDAGRIHIHKNIYNKPLLEIDGQKYFVSITHSHDYAGIIVSEKLEVGIDIEQIDPRVTRIMHKFMNEGEMHFAGRSGQCTEQTLIWSAKECLYKLYGNKELDFKGHLFIEPFIADIRGSFLGRIEKDPFKTRLRVYYEIFDAYVLSYCTHSLHLHSSHQPR